MTPELKSALDVLRLHNLWRRGLRQPMVDPTTLGDAFDVILAEVPLLGVVKKVRAKKPACPNCGNKRCGSASINLGNGSTITFRQCGECDEHFDRKELK